MLAPDASLRKFFEALPSSCLSSRHAAANFRMLVQGLGFWISDVRIEVWGLGFGVWDLEFGIWSLRFGVLGLGFGVLGLGFGFWGLGFGVLGL